MFLRLGKVQILTTRGVMFLPYMHSLGRVETDRVLVQCMFAAHGVELAVRGNSSRVSCSECMQATVVGTGEKNVLLETMYLYLKWE